MQEYYRQWLFKHPYPEDFKKALENGNDPVRIIDSILSCTPQLGHDTPIRLITASASLSCIASFNRYGVTRE